MPDNLQHAVAIRVRTLRDFNERVERIRRFAVYRFARRHLQTTSAQEALGESPRSGTRRPSQEQIDAFVNSLRFFIQNNERTSFRNLARIYTILPLPMDLKREFQDCRARLNGWLDGKSSLGMGGSPLVHRRILWTFVYGDVAHRSPKKREELHRWRENALFFPLLQTHFVNTIGNFTRFLDEAAATNRKAIRHING